MTIPHAAPGTCAPAAPRIFDDPKYGIEARKLFDDALRLLDQIVTNRWLTAHGVYGFWPANSVGDDVIISSPLPLGEGSWREVRDGELPIADCRLPIGNPLTDHEPEISNFKFQISNQKSPPLPLPLPRFHFLRQQWERQGQSDFRSLADYIAPTDSGRTDYLGAFAVTTGVGIEAIVERFEKDHDDYNSILTKALADRLAEAFAELLHARARRDWGFGSQENLSPDDMIEEKYRGIRPAPGYPACPDHTEKRTLFDLLQAETHTGIQLTESYAMYPAASVSGFYFAHPQARYFTVDRLAKDQVESYAARKGMPITEVERWLSPNLGY